MDKDARLPIAVNLTECGRTALDRACEITGDTQMDTINRALQMYYRSLADARRAQFSYHMLCPNSGMHVDHVWHDNRGVRQYCPGEPPRQHHSEK